MIDSHFDPDQIEVENFLEERDENSIFKAQDEFILAVANDDWLDTQESIAATEEYLANQEIHQTEMENIRKVAVSEHWDDANSEMDYDEVFIFDDEVPAITINEKADVPETVINEEIEAIKSKINVETKERDLLKSSLSSNNGWTSTRELKKIQNLTKNINLLERELNDQVEQDNWDRSYAYLPNENHSDWLIRMGKQENKIPCICSFIANNVSCKHEKNHGYCKFLHISKRPNIRKGFHHSSTKKNLILLFYNTLLLTFLLITISSSLSSFQKSNSNTLHTM